MLLYAGLLEGSAWIVLRLAYGQPNKASERLYRFDAELGWTNVAGRYFADRYGEGEHVTLNSAGIRASSEFATDVPPGRFRIVFLGDSFTYGICGDDETYPAQLGRMRPELEIVNMAVPGYGLDQMFLRYRREGSRFESDLLVLAIIEDDVERMRSTVFLTRYGKPRLAIRGGELEVTDAPVPAWRDPDGASWIVRLPGSSAAHLLISATWAMASRYDDARPLAARVLAELAEASAARGQSFALLYLPSSFRRAVDIDSAASRTDSLAAWLSGIAAQQGIIWWDATDAFRRFPDSELSAYLHPVGPYRAKGNQLLAEFLLERVEGMVHGHETPAIGLSDGDLADRRR